MMSSEADLNHLIGDWLAVTRDAAPPLPLGEIEAERRASELLQAILDRRVTPASIVLDEETKQILSVLVRQVADSIQDPERKLHSADAVYQFIRRLTWPSDAFGEQQDLLLECAEIGFGAVGVDHGGILRRRLGLPADSVLPYPSWIHAGDSRAVGISLRHFDALLPWPQDGSPSEQQHRISPDQGWKAAEEVLSIPPSERAGSLRGTRLDDPELLLSICEALRSRIETSPASVRDEARFFYRFLERPPRGIGLFDEREYFLGELALTAGTACRILFHRAEAKRWFERAESYFPMSSNGLAHVARLAYQRMALAVEERRFEEVLELVPTWQESFERMELAEDALKCLFLRGAALHELGRLSEAIAVLSDICREAEAHRNTRLTAIAASNLAQYCRALGDLNEAIAYARKALPLLQQLDNRTNLVKLRWCVGDILREQGKIAEAIDSYRQAAESAREVGTRNDEVSIRLALAEALIDAGHERAAESEIRVALPIIEEEKMVPEGYAALSLLRDALRLRQVDRKALHQLHGYFRDSQS